MCLCSPLQTVYPLLIHDPLHLVFVHFCLPSSLSILYKSIQLQGVHATSIADSYHTADAAGAFVAIGPAANMAAAAAFRPLHAVGEQSDLAPRAAVERILAHLDCPSDRFHLRKRHHGKASVLNREVAARNHVQGRV